MLRMAEMLYYYQGLFFVRAELLVGPLRERKVVVISL